MGYLLTTITHCSWVGPKHIGRPVARPARVPAAWRIVWRLGAPKPKKERGCCGVAVRRGGKQEKVAGAEPASAAESRRATARALQEIAAGRRHVAVSAFH